MTQRTHSAQGSPGQVERLTQSKQMCPITLSHADIFKRQLKGLRRYETTFVFNNDFPALLEDVPEPEDTGDPLFTYVLPLPFLHNAQYQKSSTLIRSAAARGTCRVMCFSPKSNVTLPLMSQPEIKAVIDTWVAEMTTLGQKYKSVTLFYRCS